jgi:spermidine synthase
VTSRRLSSGREARFERAEDGLVLVIDGIEQSHIAPPGAIPRHASTRWMLAAALECLASGGRRALHLGGGAATLPRLLQHELPGLTQRVVELEPALAELIRAEVPLPDGVELEVGDGRAVLEAQGQPMSIVLSDVFSGGSVPAPFTSVEFYAAARAALEPGGSLLVNSADGPPLSFVRAQLATVRAVFAHVGLISTGSTLAGARFGNVVLLASDAPLPLDAIRERLRGEAPPVAVLPWSRLERFVADAAPDPVTDATAVDSAPPARSAYLGPGALPPSLLERDGDGSRPASLDASGTARPTASSRTLGSGAASSSGAALS